MYTIIAHLKSVSTYSQSRYHDSNRLPKESHEDYEIRTWREKAHHDADGNVFIPPMSFKLSLDAAVKRTGKQIPGRGKCTYTKHFVSGVMCYEPVEIGYNIEDANCNGDGKTRKIECWRGMMDPTGKKSTTGGTRVKRMFPDFPEWEADVNFHVLDDTITVPIFKEMLEEAGKFVGIGRFRPENGGYYGRFEVVSVTKS
jgi:hypothetical protein